MGKFWVKSGLDKPIKLMNKDNAAAVNAGPSAAHDHALQVSTGGAERITTLACMIFNHKDDKKGQQDSYWIFFELRLGYMIKFPDTSNTRFQSHCMAAATLLLYLPYFLEFLLLVHDKKENRSFNHMKQNVFEGLKDIPTLTELCVLALYAQATSHPYCQRTPQSDSHYSYHSCHLLQSPIHPSTQTTEPPPAARNPTVTPPTCPTYVAGLCV